MQYSSMHSVEQLADLLDTADETVTTLANASAFLFALLRDVNWAGFYLLKDGDLYLGPFQGKPACTRIPAGKGVCQTAIAENRTQRVDDVHAFAGHIACDGASRSELVVVLHNEHREPIGVLDIDSPVKARFGEEDKLVLERFVEILNAHIRWEQLLIEARQTR